MPKAKSGYKIAHDDIEQIGILSDKADNLIGASNLPVSDRIHIEGMRGGLEDLRDDLRKIYLQVTGENPWEEE